MGRLVPKEGDSLVFFTYLGCVSYALVLIHGATSVLGYLLPPEGGSFVFCHVVKL